MDEGMNASELLVKESKKNQVRKDIMIVEESQDKEEAIRKLKEQLEK